MGYESLQHPELYDAIYLHTHPRGKRIIPNSIPNYIHAETFRVVSTLLVGDGIPIEFESIERSGMGRNDACFRLPTIIEIRVKWTLQRD